MMTRTPAMAINGRRPIVSNNGQNSAFSCYVKTNLRSLTALWAYLKKKGVNTDKIWENITDLIIKTIIM